MMATLYDVDVRTINEHIKKIYSDSELEEDSTIRNFRIVQTEGSRQVTRDTKHYNLQMTIVVGFNVNNQHADDREILQEARKIIAEITKTKAEMNFIIRILTVCNSRRLEVRQD